MKAVVLYKKTLKSGIKPSTGFIAHDIWLFLFLTEKR